MAKTILYILLVIVVILFVISLLGARYKNKYKLYMVFGKKGSGKSTFLMKQALKYHKKGYTIYTNMTECVIPHVRIIDVNNLGKFVPSNDSLLILDEVGMIWDSRDFKNFKAEVRDFFKLQRHYHVVCYLASQSFDIDKKLRDLTDGMYLTVCLLNVFTVAKRITRKIVLTESTSEAESRISENLKFTPFWNWEYTFIPRYAACYDSFVTPAKPLLPYTANSDLDGFPYTWRQFVTRSAHKQLDELKNRPKKEKTKKPLKNRKKERNGNHADG